MVTALSKRPAETLSAVAADDSSSGCDRGDGIEGKQSNQTQGETEVHRADAGVENSPGNGNGNYGFFFISIILI